MSIERCLSEEITSEFDELRKIELGSDSYRHAVDGLTKLLDRAIEMDRMELEVQEKEISRDVEERLRERQLQDEKKDRLVKNVLTLLGIAVPTVVTIWGTNKSLKFEETGSVTTIMGRGFINKLLPKK